MKSMMSLIYVILPNGQILQSGSIYNKDLRHFEALKMLIEDNKLDLSNDFFRQLDELCENGALIYLNYTYDNFTMGQYLLPENITEEQLNFVKKFSYKNGYLFVNKNGVEVEKTTTFNIENYYGKEKYK